MTEEERLRGLWGEARELSLGTSGGVERVELDEQLSALGFMRDFVSANKPCIISASAYTAKRWPAISESLWEDDEYLCSVLNGSSSSTHKVSVHLTPDGRADALVPLPPNHPPTTDDKTVDTDDDDGGVHLCFASACVRSMEFPKALRLISQPDSDPMGMVAYAQQQNDCLRSEYSALLDRGDVEPHIPWATEAFGGKLPEAVNMWIGNARSVTSFHKDHYENLYAVITGEKHFLLLPPTEVHRLYIRRYPAATYEYHTTESGNHGLKLELKEEEEEQEEEEGNRHLYYVPWCSVDPYPQSSEELKRQMSSFPLYFNGPPPFRCTVKAGEILYLPSMWFHHVTQSPDRNGRTIAINYWYDMQFDIKYAYFNFLHSIHIHATPQSNGSVHVFKKRSHSSKLQQPIQEDEYELHRKHDDDDDDV